jgi:hypothetical protein
LWIFTTASPKSPEVLKQFNYWNATLHNRVSLFSFTSLFTHS